MGVGLRLGGVGHPRLRPSLLLQHLPSLHGFAPFPVAAHFSTQLVPIPARPRAAAPLARRSSMSRLLRAAPTAWS